MNRRVGGVQFAAQRVVIGELAMVGFGVRVGGRAHILEVCFCQRRFVLRQGACPGRSASAKKKSADDEQRYKDYPGGAQLEIGKVINSYSQPLSTVISSESREISRSKDRHLFAHITLRGQSCIHA